MKEKNKKKTIIHEELNEKQQSMFDEWVGHLKALYGEIGTLTWKVTSTGIGSGIVVYSHNSKTELDLTDVDSW